MTQDKKITQIEFGTMVGISQPAVSGLISNGIIDEDGTLEEWILQYCGRLRDEASGRSSILTNERARLAAEQADRIALQNKVARQEYAPVGIIETTMASVSRQICGILEALPIKLKREAGLTVDQVNIVDREITEARNIAVNILPEWDSDSR